MYWPDTNSVVDVEPARKPVSSAVRKFFTEGGAGVPPSVPGGDWYNQITNELLNVLAAAGIDPSKVDDDQLVTAISKLVAKYQRVSPINYGAVDDYDGTTGTNSLTAFQQAFERLNEIGGGISICPKRILGVTSSMVMMQLRLSIPSGFALTRACQSTSFILVGKIIAPWSTQPTCQRTGRWSSNSSTLALLPMLVKMCKKTLVRYCQP